MKAHVYEVGDQLWMVQTGWSMLFPVYVTKVTRAFYHLKAEPREGWPEHRVFRRAGLTTAKIFPNWSDAWHALVEDQQRTILGTQERLAREEKKLTEVMNMVPGQTR